MLEKTEEEEKSDHQEVPREATTVSVGLKGCHMEQILLGPIGSSLMGYS